MKVLEIGCGANPWFGRQLYYRGMYSNTPFTDMVDDLIRQRHTYICLDKEPYLLGLCREYLERHDGALQRHTRGVYEFLEQDAERLPYKDGTIDMVIMSDVLTSSPWPYCGCNLPMARSPAGSTCPTCGLPVSPGTTDEQKRAILAEALRVMKPASRLILGFYQTPHFALDAMTEVERLEKAGTLVKLSGIKRLPMRHYDEAGVLELMFYKT